MKRIFVPTDFSKCANNALRYAFELAKVLPAEIVLFSAVHPYKGIDNNLYNLTLLEEVMKAKAETLYKTIRRYTKQPDFQHVKVSVVCEVGYAAPLILAEAQKAHADLIIMGTTGATGMKEIFIGSIASEVIQSTHIPVLAIPEKATYQGFGKLVFSTDFKTKPNPVALEWLEILNDLQSNPQLDIIHIVTNEGQSSHKTEEQHWRKMMEAIPHQFNYLHDNNISVALQNYCEAVKAHVLAIVAPHHSFFYRLFFPSQSRTTIFHSRIPIMVLPEA